MAREILEEHANEGYLGLRMTADEFLALPEDSRHYELIDGVVVMSPSASPDHQDIMGELLFQLRSFLNTHPFGKAVSDVDIKIAPKRVYRPDIVYLCREKWEKSRERITVVPDLVVEIVSPSSRSYDSNTKRQDYEAAGVGEYWLIDPAQESFTFLVLRGGAFHEATEQAGRYRATIVPGFELDIDRIKALF